MKPLYLDTALMVASLVHEPGTVVAHQLLRNAADRVWLISTWVETELASALAMQYRRGAISPAERDEAWLRFQTLRDGRLQVLELTTADFDAAARLCLVEAPALRAGDALHIALCQRQKCQLVSFDQAMCAAAVHHRVARQLLRISSG